MEEALENAGLNAKEIKAYEFLLNEDSLTASQISKSIKESRTNAYMILGTLVDQGLVDIDDSQPVQRYRAKHPRNLQKMLANKQQELRQTQAGLAAVLPQLESTFNLGQHKPGTLYLEGIEGFKALLEDMTKSPGTVWLLASSKSYSGTEIRAVLDKGITKRRAKNIKTNAIFPEQARTWKIKEQAAAKNFEVRFWGKELILGEVVQYDTKVAFTVYEPALVITVITNEVLADTFRSILCQIWEGASV